jgi:hypothetical protein
MIRQPNNTDIVSTSIASNTSGEVSESTSSKYSTNASYTASTYTTVIAPCSTSSSTSSNVLATNLEFSTAFAAQSVFFLPRTSSSSTTSNAPSTGKAKPPYFGKFKAFTAPLQSSEKTEQKPASTNSDKQIKLIAHPTDKNPLPNNSGRYNVWFCVSMGNIMQDDERLLAFIEMVNDFQKGRVGNLHIILTGQLAAIYELGYSENKDNKNWLDDTADKINRNWLQVNSKHLGKLKIPYEIVSWQDFTDQEAYAKNLENLHKLYETDSDYQEKVKNTLDEIRENHPSATDEQLKEYLFKETAVVMNLPKDVYVAYPAQKFNAAIEYVLDKFKIGPKFAGYKVVPKNKKSKNTAKYQNQKASVTHETTNPNSANAISSSVNYDVASSGSSSSKSSTNFTTEILMGQQKQNITPICSDDADTSLKKLFFEVAATRLTAKIYLKQGLSEESVEQLLSLNYAPSITISSNSQTLYGNKKANNSSTLQPATQPTTTPLQHIVPDRGVLVTSQ